MNDSSIIYNLNKLKMSILQNNNKFISLFVALFAFFIFVFFTKDIYWEIQWNQELNKTKIEILEGKWWLDEKLKVLNNLKLNLEDKTNNDFIKLKKFTWDFSEDKMIVYINDYIEAVNEEKIILELNWISFSEIHKSELGFKKIDINLNMKVSDRYSLIDLLDYFTDNSNKYSFFITDLNFDIEKSGPYKINIPLQMYIK